MKHAVARFIEKIGFEAVILHEQANQGLTIIEKFEANTDVGFAIILYTQNDIGNRKKESEEDKYNPRARQNVVFGHGYLIARLSRGRVITLVTNKTIELPSDISDVDYLDDQRWQLKLRKN